MSRKKILVVDDNPVIVKALSLKLKAAGYDVLSAMDGSKALAIVRSDDPALIILDINFPLEDAEAVPWDGFKIMQWLERLNEDWHKPIIVITGEEGLEYEERAKAAGAVAFFRKPVDNNELLGAIARELGVAPQA